MKKKYAQPSKNINLNQSPRFGRFHLSENDPDLISSDADGKRDSAGTKSKRTPSGASFPRHRTADAPGSDEAHQRRTDFPRSPERKRRPAAERMESGRQRNAYEKTFHSRGEGAASGFRRGNAAGRTALSPSSASEMERERLRFSTLLLKELSAEKYRELLPDPGSPDALSALDYQTELELKLRAIRQFWQEARLQGSIAAILPSPRPRNYRTSSKRRVLYVRGRMIFSMGYGTGHAGNARKSIHSPLEAKLHGEIYEIIHTLLKKEHYEMLAKAMNYCVLKGSYEKVCVIMNLFHANGPIIRKLKNFAEELRSLNPHVLSAFMYLDESRSDYYLDSTGTTENAVQLKKLFGPEFLDLTLDGMKLLYPPTVFSQVNESMLPEFVSQARKLLSPDSKTRLIDLYCGYGLFSAAMAKSVHSVVGVDIEGPAIRAASDNAAHLFPGKSMKYIAESINGDSLRERLPVSEMKEYILLDPPRGGTANGVIEALLERKPAKVLAIFCSTDQIPKELKIWTANGYCVSDIRVFDMFPGSMNLETMVLLEPK